MTEEEYIALFDRYNRDEMDADERLAFERLLIDSPEIKASFEAYISFSNEIKDGYSYAAQKRQLNAIHADLYQRKKSFFLRPTFIIPTGIAASIALIISLNIGNFNAQLDAGYKPLANNADEAEATTVNQNSFGDSTYGYGNSNNPNETLSDQLPFRNGTPRGTAFQLSADGYFLTSKHVLGDVQKVILQLRSEAITFEADVVYVDSLLDFAVLHCSAWQAKNLAPLPYNSATYPHELGEDVFTLGYPKSAIVYTKGVISSESGYKSDTNYYEVSLPSNAGQSGAPLFNELGEFIGIITAKRADQESVTYVLKPTVLFRKLAAFNDSILNEINATKTNQISTIIDRVKIYRQFIFEVHPMQSP